MGTAGHRLRRPPEVRRLSAADDSLPAKTGAVADAEDPDDVKVLDRKGREFHARKGSPNANAWQGKETNAAPYPPASKPVQIHRNPATQICNVGRTRRTLHDYLQRRSIRAWHQSNCGDNR